MRIFSLLGVLLVGISTFITCKASSRYYEEKIKHYNDFFSLLLLVRHRIDSSGSKISEILKEISSESFLVKSGFSNEAIEKGLLLSFKNVENYTLLNPNDKELLNRYFSEFGKNFLQHEIEKTDRCIIDFEKSLRSLRESIPSKIRINKTIIVSTALLFIIVFI